MTLSGPFSHFGVPAVGTSWDGLSPAKWHENARSNVEHDRKPMGSPLIKLRPSQISQGARYNMHRFGISVARSTHPPMELKSGSRESHLTTVLRKVSILIRSNSKAPPDNNPALCFYSILQQPWHSC